MYRSIFWSLYIGPYFGPSWRSKFWSLNPRSTFWTFMKVQNLDLGLKVLILLEGPHGSMKDHIGTMVMFYIRSKFFAYILWYNRRGWCVYLMIASVYLFYLREDNKIVFNKSIRIFHPCLSKYENISFCFLSRVFLKYLKRTLNLMFTCLIWIILNNSNQFLKVQKTMVIHWLLNTSNNWGGNFWEAWRGAK